MILFQTCFLLASKCKLHVFRCLGLPRPVNNTHENQKQATPNPNCWRIQELLGIPISWVGAAWRLRCARFCRGYHLLRCFLKGGKQREPHQFTFSDRFAAFTLVQRQTKKRPPILTHTHWQLRFPCICLKTIKTCLFLPAHKNH